ncbi:MAG: RagB/SusD family nutrient uptake outer membrane protein [Bacteroidales bacterium]
MKTLKLLILTAATLTLLGSCEGPLEEEIFSQLAPSTLLTSEEGMSSLLNSAYANAHLQNVAAAWSVPYLGGNPAGELWGAGGSIESLWVQLQDFTWGADHSQMSAQWSTFYAAIRDANIVLDNIDNPDFGSDFVALTTAEVHFIRGWCYSQLYNLFGPVPVYLSSLDDPLQAKASEADMLSLIESELNLAIDGLPTDAAFGRGTRGAAMGILCKHYLNVRRWQDAADMAQDVMDLGVYGLEATYGEVFSMDNEGNSEFIWALTKSPTAGVNAQNALTYPPDYPRPYANNGVFAARTYLFDDFVNSFDPSDQRRDLIVTEWVSTGTGATITGLGMDQLFPAKWAWDPGSVGWMAGNDIPMVRYADILLRGPRP